MKTTIYLDVLNGRTGHALNRLYRIKQDQWQHEILEDKIEFGENCNGKFEKLRCTTERFYATLGDMIINIYKTIHFERIEAFRRVVKEKKYVVKIIPIKQNPVYLEGEEIKEIFESIDGRRIYAKYELEHRKKRPSDIENSSKAE